MASLTPRTYRKPAYGVSRLLVRPATARAPQAGPENSSAGSTGAVHGTGRGNGNSRQQYRPSRWRSWPAARLLSRATAGALAAGSASVRRRGQEIATGRKHELNRANARPPRALARTCTACANYAQAAALNP
jgi:hypothetical protein